MMCAKKTELHSQFFNDLFIRFPSSGTPPYLNQNRSLLEMCASVYFRFDFSLNKLILLDTCNSQCKHYFRIDRKNRSEIGFSCAVKCMLRERNRDWDSGVLEILTVYDTRCAIQCMLFVEIIIGVHNLVHKSSTLMKEKERQFSRGRFSLKFCVCINDVHAIILSSRLLHCIQSYAWSQV